MDFFEYLRRARDAVRFERAFQCCACVLVERFAAGLLTSRQFEQDAHQFLALDHRSRLTFGRAIKGCCTTPRAICCAQNDAILGSTWFRIVTRPRTRFLPRHPSAPVTACVNIVTAALRRSMIAAKPMRTSREWSMWKVAGRSYPDLINPSKTKPPFALFGSREDFPPHLPRRGSA